MEPSKEINGRKTGIWSDIFEWIKVIVIAVIISLPIRFFIAEPFIVNGASMDPTFATGQFLIVDRLTYRFDEPKRGDVIVFRYPNDPKTYYIKRIIGLPNEKLELNNGVVSIDQSFSSSSPLTLEEPYLKSENLSYEDLKISLGANEYFVMGDNRGASSDSRVWGPLDKDFIVGRPIIRLFPITKLSISPGK